MSCILYKFRIDRMAEGIAILLISFKLPHYRNYGFQLRKVVRVTVSLPNELDPLRTAGQDVGNQHGRIILLASGYSCSVCSNSGLIVIPAITETKREAFPSGRQARAQRRNSIFKPQARKSKYNGLPGLAKTRQMQPLFPRVAHDIEKVKI